MIGHTTLCDITPFNLGEVEYIDVAMDHSERPTSLKELTRTVLNGGI